MEGALLCALLLLLLAPRRAAEQRKGETCYSWEDRLERPVEAFQCPRASDEQSAVFCCGICWRPFCCSSRAARLDQQQCALDNQPEPTIDHRQATVTARRPPNTEVEMPHIWYVFQAVTAMGFPISIYMIFLMLCKGRIKERMKQQRMRRIQKWLRGMVGEGQLEPPPEIAVIDAPSLHGSSSSNSTLDNPDDKDFAPPGSRAPEDPGIILSPAALSIHPQDPRVQLASEKETAV